MNTQPSYVTAIPKKKPITPIEEEKKVRVATIPPAKKTELAENTASETGGRKVRTSPLPAVHPILLLSMEAEPSKDSIYSALVEREIVFSHGTQYAVVLPASERGRAYTRHKTEEAAALKAQKVQAAGKTCVVVNLKGELFTVKSSKAINPTLTQVKGETVKCAIAHSKRGEIIY